MMIDIDMRTLGQLGNNCYLITDRAAGLSALVDCTDADDEMLSMIKNKKLEYILLTHGHYDHIGGVAQIKKFTGAKVVISREDEPMLSSSRASLAAYSGIPQDKSQADILTFDGDVITLGESKIKVIATPGHTKGGVCYICDNALFTGDTLFFSSCGRTDFPGGSMAEMNKSLKRLYDLEGDYNVYPGHENLTTLDFERKNNPYMKACAD